MKTHYMNLTNYEHIYNPVCTTSKHNVNEYWRYVRMGSIFGYHFANCPKAKIYALHDHEGHLYVLWRSELDYKIGKDSIFKSWDKVGEPTDAISHLVYNHDNDHYVIDDDYDVVSGNEFKDFNIKDIM